MYMLHLQTRCMMSRHEVITLSDNLAVLSRSAAAAASSSGVRRIASTGYRRT